MDLPKDTNPDARVGWYSYKQYEVIRDSHHHLWAGEWLGLPVYRNHLSQDLAVTEVRKFSEGPPAYPDVQCVGIIGDTPVKYTG